MAFRDKARRFLSGWGRDIALAGGGAATGLLIALALGTGVSDNPPPAPPHSALAPAPAPAIPSPPVPEPERAAAPAKPAPAPAVVQPPWRRYAVAPGDVAGRPMIAVIIDDMGVDQARSARAMRLPAAVTLAFLPYARDLARQAAAGRRMGHELLVHVPMEPDQDGVDPGPDVLRADAPPAVLRGRLDRALSRFSGFVGLNNHMGSRFTADTGAMRVVLSDVARRGLLFVDSRTTAKSVAPATARGLGVPFAARDVFLDDDPSPAAIRVQMRRAETVARRKGHAVAIGHPRDATLDALEGWLWGAERRGFALVPVSAVVRGRRGDG